MKLTSRKLLSILLTLVMLFSLVLGMSMTAYADGGSDYTVTIPATLTVSGSGWNDAGGISVTGTLETNKKLTVTASSDGEYALVSGENKVAYTLAAASGGAETTAWEFTALPGSATLGIIVEDYSSKPAGTYTDTVTFTAKVEDTSSTITIGGVTLNYSSGDTWRKIANKNSDKIDSNDRVGGGVIRHGGDWLCKDVADNNHLVRPDDVIVPNGNYMWY